MKKIILTTAFVVTSAPTFAATVPFGDVSSNFNGVGGDSYYVGFSNPGSLIVNGGTTVNLNSGTDPVQLNARPKLDIGDSSTGVVTVDGPTTSVILTGNNTGAKVEMSANPGGNGTLNLTNGALLSLDDPNLMPVGEGVYFDVGQDGGVSAVNIDASTLDQKGLGVVNLNVAYGNAASGQFNVNNGSNVVLYSYGTIPTTRGPAVAVSVGGWANSGTGNVGTMRISDSTILVEASDGGANFDVGGMNSTGVLDISGPTANLVVKNCGIGAAGFAVGSGSGGQGIVSVDNGAQLNLQSCSSANMRIATADAFGNLNIRNGGIVDVSAPTGTIQIGNSYSNDPNDISSAIATLDGPGSTLSASNEIIVGLAQGSSGRTSGNLIINNGAQVNTNMLQVGSGGVVAGSGGTINANTRMLSGGTIAPGLSPGTLSQNGNLEIFGGTFIFEIGGTSSGTYDIFNVNGNVTAYSLFDLNVSFINGFKPSSLFTLDIFKVNGQSVGLDQFANINLLGLSGTYSSKLLTSNGQLALSGFTPTAIPLPASLWLLIASLIGLVGVRLRYTKPKIICLYC